MAATHEKFLPAARFGNTGSVQPAFNRLNTLYDELEMAAAKLARLAEGQAAEAIRVVHSSFYASRVFIVFGTVLSLVLSAAIGLALAAAISRRVSRLTSATIAVAGGDLLRRVELSGGDELEVLGENFNAMVESLRRKRKMLEVRNTELHESLQRQRELTEDLIKRERAEEEAHKAKAAAEAASQAKSIFLATMSHELRTPLNSILGYAQILHLESAARGDERILPELSRIQAAGKHLLTIISNILDFSKIEQGKMDLQVSRFDAGVLAREVVSIVAPLALERGNALVLKGDAGVGEIENDAAKLRQVLFNLLSNAVKFTENGEISVLAERQCSSGAERLRLIVRDTGIGIREESLRQLFQPFTQVDSSVRRKFEGTGLGLTVSQQLCHLMGGEIRVESRCGVGSTFTILLPVSAPEAGSGNGGQIESTTARSLAPG